MPAACQSPLSSHTWRSAANGLPVGMGNWELGLIWISSSSLDIRASYLNALSLQIWPETWMFSSPSSREELKEKFFCTAVEQEVVGPEPQRCFGFWGSAIVHPSLRTWSWSSSTRLISLWT